MLLKPFVCSLSQGMEQEFPAACCIMAASNRLAAAGLFGVRWLWSMKNFQLQPDRSADKGFEH